MIPAPRNALTSYHYFKNYDLDKLAGLNLIGDSGAFSAHHQGVDITVEELADWAHKWRHRLGWVASLDVIGKPDATRRNWRHMVNDLGINAVPTIHFGAAPSDMDYYIEQGIDFIGLGGLVRRPLPAQMRWLVSVFRYARDHHPHVRFHGWGVTHPQILLLPFYSVDSSGWSSGYRYGRLNLRDPHTGRTYAIKLDGRETYTPRVARLLRDHYGVNPSQVATSGAHNRPLVVRLSALSASVAEQQFRKLHRRDQLTPPTWGINRTVLAGPHLHLAMTSTTEMDVMAEMNGPHIHLAEGAAEHLAIVADMNRTHEGDTP